MTDSFSIHQNDDGSFSLEWDRNDPEWNWLNDLTTKDIESMLEKEIIKNHNERH